MEAIVNNRIVKTVRKLQVLLSLHDEKQQSNSKINKDFSFRFKFISVAVPNRYVNVSCKRGATTRFGTKSLYWKTGSGNACIAVLCNTVYLW